MSGGMGCSWSTSDADLAEGEGFEPPRAHALAVFKFAPLCSLPSARVIFVSEMACGNPFPSACGCPHAPGLLSRLLSSVAGAGPEYTDHFSPPAPPWSFV